mgnify:CR=1 FL=1
MKTQTEQKAGHRRVVIRGYVVFAVSIALLLVFNSAKLRSAVRDYPANWATDRLVLAADEWHGWMGRLGADRLADGLRAPFEAFREWRWPS